MILTHLVAENVLKYEELKLANLPRKGVITICGQNESGKSTIGETVCFALFGRTFSIGEDEDLKRIIRWGEIRCSVQLGFSAGGVDYEIARFLDDEGNHGARLYHAQDPDRLIAKGLAAVSEALDGLIGFRYDEFIESFYLAQREITTPHPHSHAVKTMAGIASLERVAETLKNEIEAEEARLPDSETQLAEIGEDIDSIGIDPDHLGTLQARRGKVQEAVDGIGARDDALEKASAEYEDKMPAVASTKMLAGIGKSLAVISFLIALVTGAIWYLFTQMPGSEITAGLESTLVSISASWGEESVRYVGIAAIVSGGIFLLSWLLSFSSAKKLASLKVCGESLADGLVDATSEVPGSAQGGSELGTEDAKKPEAGGIELVSLAEDKVSAIRGCQLDPAAGATVVSEVRDELGSKLKLQEGRLERLDAEISEEIERRSKADGLGGVAADLTAKLKVARRKIEVRKKADELIQGSARHISQRFNHDLRNQASKTLPLFTEGRYEHLHIDTDLNVRVFSSLKRDFMDLEEISSGTQRQIMLAVRLALSQELVNTTAGGNQFIFLDEPFAFFDPERTRNAMEILPKLSDEITQIWVIAQEFPADTNCELAIECARSFETLDVGSD